MKSFYVIVNPSANLGRAANDWHQIQQYLDEHNIDYHAEQTSAVGDANKCIQSFLKRLEFVDFEKYVVIVVGGNETLNEVLTGIKMADVYNIPLAYICVGKHHEFADQLGLARKPLIALKQILNTTEATDFSLIQYYESNHEETGYFLDFYSIGMGANLAKIRERGHQKWLHQHIRWLADTIDVCKAYFQSADSFKTTLRINHQYKFYKRACIVDLHNQTQEANFSNNDAPIEITIIDRVNLLLFLTFMIVNKVGDSTKLSFVHHWNADKLHITINSLEQTQIDNCEISGKYNDLYLKLINYPFWINSDSVSLDERREK